MASSGLAAPAQSTAQPSPAFLSRVVVDLPAGARLADQDPWFATYLDISDRADLAWSLKLNAARLNNHDSTQRDGNDAASETYRSLVQRQRAGHADAVLTEVDGQWHLLRAVVGAKTVVNDLGWAPLSHSATAALTTILGYDAVVIAQEGERVTAQTAQLIDDGDLYAVSFADSAQLYTVPGDHTIAKSALLRLVDSHGHLSVFKIVSAASTVPLAVGTKLRLERRPPGARE